MYPVIFLVGLAVSPVISQWNFESFDGPCPTSEVGAIKNFDQEKFQDKWYVIQRYAKSTSMDCVKLSYIWKNWRRGFREMLNERDLEHNYELEVLGILVEQEKFSNEGKFTYYLTIMKWKWNYYVVDTDYDKYAVVWVCNDKRTRNLQNLMVLARDRDFDINSMESLNATLAKHPFDRSKLKDINHKNDRCLEN